MGPEYRSRRTPEGGVARTSLPIVGVVCSLTPPDIGAPDHAVFDPYLMALTAYAHCVPILIPAALNQPGEGDVIPASILARIDGLLLPGSPSMIAPERYGEVATRQGLLQDPRRDARTFPLVGLALKMAVPLLGICRGAQEINCALGGTLHQAVHDLPGRDDHRALSGLPQEADKYLPRHRISLVKGGWLDALSRDCGVDRSNLRVSTLHEQSIDQIGAGVVVEAVADDGIIEAVRVATAKSFAVGVQWHPEWHLDSQPLNRFLFQEFGQACLQRARFRASILEPSLVASHAAAAP